MGVLGLVIFFVGYENRALFLTLTCVRTVPMSIVGILAFMFTPDCAEYGQYKSCLLYTSRRFHIPHLRI